MGRSVNDPVATRHHSYPSYEAIRRVRTAELANHSYRGGDTYLITVDDSTGRALTGAVRFSLGCRDDAVKYTASLARQFGWEVVL